MAPRKRALIPALLVAVLAIVLVYAVRGRRAGHPGPAPAPSPEVASASAPPAGSSLLTAGAPTKAAAPEAAPSPEASLGDDLLRRIGNLPLDARVERAIRAAGEGKAAKDVELYLRMRANHEGLSAADSMGLESAVLPSLQQNPDETLAVVGRALGALEGDAERRETRIELLRLAATVPARENAEVSRSALANLSEIYAPDSGVNPEERFGFAVATLQAYLATTSATASGANAAVARAMGGQIDPAVKTAYQNMMLDRFPGRR